MANRSYNTISELKVCPADEEDDMGYHNWTLRGRVTRLCDNSKNKNGLFYIFFVLIDEEGNAVHAQISKSNWQHFRDKVIDGKIHIVKHFYVLPNLETKRVVGDTKVMIKFHYSTYVKALDITETHIPLHRFEFLEFQNVTLRRDNPTVLTDLFGLVVKEIVRPNNFALEIENQEGQRLRVTLWDHLITEYQAEKEKHINQNGALIVTVSSLLVGTDKDKSTSIRTSRSSRIYINIEIPEVISLRDYLRDNIEVQIECKTDKVRKIDIASILAHCKEEFKQDLICYCTAKVTGIERRKSWNYKSCFRCPYGPQLKDSINWCYRCKKPVEAETLRYCVELKVEDGSGKTRFIMFDNDARRLIGQDAQTLKDSQPPEDPDNEVPDHTPQIIYDTFNNKDFIFTLKIQQENHKSVQKKVYKIIDISEKKNKDPKITSLETEDTEIASMETEDTETLAQMKLTRLKRWPKFNDIVTVFKSSEGDYLSNDCANLVEPSDDGTISIYAAFDQLSTLLLPEFPEAALLRQEAVIERLKLLRTKRYVAENKKKLSTGLSGFLLPSDEGDTRVEFRSPVPEFPPSGELRIVHSNTRASGRRKRKADGEYCLAACDDGTVKWLRESECVKQNHVWKVRLFERRVEGVLYLRDELRRTEPNVYNRYTIIGGNVNGSGKQIIGGVSQQLL